MANRARALLAFNRGERIGDVVHWLNWSRMGLWYLWRRYEQYGVDATFDAERSGRPPVFPPLELVQSERVARTDPAAYGLHLACWDCRSPQHIVVERGVVGSIHYTTVARFLASARLQPHRSRYWKTATVDERFTTLAARILWRYERAELLLRAFSDKYLVRFDPHSRRHLIEHLEAS